MMDIFKIRRTESSIAEISDVDRSDDCKLFYYKDIDQIINQRESITDSREPRLQLDPGGIAKKVRSRN